MLISIVALYEFVLRFIPFFGGRSGSYRRQLEGLYEEALDELSDKAKYLGANGILGLTIDMDNISDFLDYIVHPCRSDTAVKLRRAHLLLRRAMLLRSRFFVCIQTI